MISTIRLLKIFWANFFCIKKYKLIQLGLQLIIFINNLLSFYYFQRGQRKTDIPLLDAGTRWVLGISSQTSTGNDYQNHGCAMPRSTCPCFCSLFCFLWPISLGCPFFFLMPSSSFPSATCKRTEAACCTSNTTVRLVAPLAWQQRRQDTGSYLPMGSCVCLAEI